MNNLTHFSIITLENRYEAGLLNTVTKGFQGMVKNVKGMWHDLTTPGKNPGKGSAPKCKHWVPLGPTGGGACVG